MGKKSGAHLHVGLTGETYDRMWCGQVTTNDQEQLSIIDDIVQTPPVTRIPCYYVIVQSSYDNAADSIVLVGSRLEGCYWELARGEHTPPLRVNDVNKVQARSADGDGDLIVNWIAFC